ncbi:MAG: DUF1573 domain-containing protein [Akkermansiaceae bacterium]|nr:DUF1573 domain-containing protein [Akkermansiaceae bacterium]
MLRSTVFLFLSAALASRLLAAGLDFPHTMAEIHAAADASSVTADFEFTNRGDKPVTVVKYDAACSCMGVHIKDGKLRYAPGESGMIRTVFEMGNFSGTVDKVVALWLDGDPPEKPSLQLTVRVHIPVLVLLEPKTLKWELGGDPAPQKIGITVQDKQPVLIRNISSSSPAFRHELRTIEQGKRYELIVTPTEINSPGLGILRIETDAALEKHRVQQAFAVVRKPTPGEAAARQK